VLDLIGWRPPCQATIRRLPARDFRRNAPSPMRRLALAALVAAFLQSSAHAADCGGRPDALGTARVLALDPHGVRVGTRSFPQTLPLGPKEVVLTFDDGPMPGTTDRVLAALAAQCVRATFFLIGRNAAAHPALVRRIRSAGHTIGHHSMSHPVSLARLRTNAAIADIERGIAAVERAAGGGPTVPFFRFPGFGQSPALLDHLARKGFAVFGADVWASDWLPMAPEVELQLVMQRLAAAGRGILVLHDTRSQTARMLPALLKALQNGGWQIVHVVPAR
jgi:peptidoglycan/xylan/chitin deacetylase (PgdA/CDA1 family)